MLARPGSWRLCPQCGYPRYVPTASTSHYACAMPEVPLPGGDTIRKCDFRTSAQAWHRRNISSEEHAGACKAVTTELVLSIHARCRAGSLPACEAYPTQSTELPQRVVAAANMQPPPQPPMQG